MVTFSFLRHRSYRIALLVTSFGAIMFLATFLDGAYETYEAREGERLGLREEFNFPLSEISGLFLKPPGAKGEREVLVIGDHAASLGIATLSGGQIKDKRIIDFSNAIVERYGICNSKKIVGCKKFLKDITTQWEAVATDVTGRIYLLHEQLGSVFVYDPSSDRLVSVINLESFDLAGEKKRQRVTADQENALGEGFVLLKNGHMLVIKERFKPTLIEFGPSGEEPAGYTPRLLVGAKDAYPLPAEKATLVPLKVWQLDRKYQQCDLAELTAVDAGQLYLLSQQCQWISKLAPFDQEASQVRFTDLWALPNKLKNAEAMLVLDDNTFIVGEDKKSLQAKNIFVLTRKPTDRLAGKL